MFSTAIRILGDGKIETLFGGDEDAGAPAAHRQRRPRLWLRDPGAGLPPKPPRGQDDGPRAPGASRFYDAIAAHFRVDGAGDIASDFATIRRCAPSCSTSLPGRQARGRRRLDPAASSRSDAEVGGARWIAAERRRKLGLAGGVFANVRLNQRLAEELPVDEVFVYPAMSDQGLAAGGVLKFLLERDGLETWLAHRYPLETLYLGRDFADGIDRVLGTARRYRGHPRRARPRRRPGCIAAGGIVAIYTKGMEYGPRALGARSILATPADAAINDTLNQRLDRSEFMPFAPVVAEEDADTVFRSRPCQGLCRALHDHRPRHVQPGWQERIPAVVHVDGTARPQTIASRLEPALLRHLESLRARAPACRSSSTPASTCTRSTPSQ